ncbi:MAG: hypothetical protein ACLQGP_17925 [Isosphaeraceae bacterium]
MELIGELRRLLATVEADRPPGSIYSEIEHYLATRESLERMSLLPAKLRSQGISNQVSPAILDLMYRLADTDPPSDLPKPHFGDKDIGKVSDIDLDPPSA